MEWGQPYLLVKGENLFNELGNKERERNQMISRNRKGSENSENDWRKGQEQERNQGGILRFQALKF